MIKGVVSALTVLAVALLLYTDLTESQCTTKYCEDHDEGNLLSMYVRNQEVVVELQYELRALQQVVNSTEERNQRVVEELQRELGAQRVEHGRLQQEVNSTEERNRDVVRQLQQEINEIKKTVARVEKRKYSTTISLFDILLFHKYNYSPCVTTDNVIIAR